MVESDEFTGKEKMISSFRLVTLSSVSPLNNLSESEAVAWRWLVVVAPLWWRASLYNTLTSLVPVAAKSLGNSAFIEEEAEGE